MLLLSNFVDIKKTPLTEIPAGIGCIFRSSPPHLCYFSEVNKDLTRTGLRQGGLILAYSSRRKCLSLQRRHGSKSMRQPVSLFQLGQTGEHCLYRHTGSLPASWLYLDPVKFMVNISHFIFLPPPPNSLCFLSNEKIGRDTILCQYNKK